MTSPGPSPPRSEKESSGAASGISTPSTDDRREWSAQAQTEAKAEARLRRADAAEAKRAAKAAAKRARADQRRRADEARAAAELESTTAAARLLIGDPPMSVAATSARTTPADDHIVEPPRAPKAPWGERRRVLAGVALAFGVLGLVCSVVLALGALLVALGKGDGDATYDLVAPVCDVLTGPLRGLFSFEGANADMKAALVAWGAGSVGYLLVGLFAQSALRSRLDD